MLPFIGFLALGWVGSARHYIQTAYQVRADGIVAGNARFQPLGDKLIRIEYSITGSFLDATTAVVSNRLPAVSADVSVVDGWLELRTHGYRLRYRLGSGPFSPNNLRISWGGGSWIPGQIDSKNLGGTPFSLDTAIAGNLTPLGQGVLSRSGYWLYNDSATPVSDGKGWIRPRTGGSAVDEYLFVYGDDYKGALQEFARLTGHVPLIPRYALGTWHSKDYDFKDWELKDLVNGFRSRKIPLDVLVLDGEWHDYGWEGYDWNRTDFPDPAGFLKWCHDQGLEVTMNTHPGQIVPEDSHTGPSRKMLGMSGPNRGVHFNLAVRPEADAFNTVLHDQLNDQGVSFWWIDGQSADMPGLDGQFWTNRDYYSHQEEHTGKRSLIYSRYGGPGNQRYPLGFSGDATASWEVLRYETGMTPVASNLLWQWSHDIGAYHGNKLEDELMARWTQFGAFSPVLRFHSAHGERRPWAYAPATEKAMTDAVRLRERLIPYAYTLEHDLWEQSLPVYRPLYLEEPRDPQSFQHPYEYFFGSNLIVAPASAPTVGGTTDVPVYLPAGKWMDYFSGRTFEGSRTLVCPVTLDQIPLFARAGSIIPTQVDKQYDAQPVADSPLVLRVYRGASGSFTLKEDDGVSLDYRKGLVASTKFTLRDSSNGFSVLVFPRDGDYAGAPVSRSIELLVFGCTKPRSVLLNGKACDWNLEADGSLKISLGDCPVKDALTVKVDNPGGYAAFAFSRQASTISDRLGALSLAAGGSEGPRLEAAAKELASARTSVESGTSTPTDLGPWLLRLAGEIRAGGGSNDLVEKILDFRWSGDPDDAQIFGFADTVSACASWDPCLPKDGIHLNFKAPSAFAAERVAPREAGFERWHVGETPKTRFGDFDAALTFAADIPGGPLVRTSSIKWSNTFVTQWNLLGPFPTMKPATDEFRPDPSGKIDFAKPVASAKWTQAPSNVTEGGVMSPRLMNLERIWPSQQVHCYASTYLYSPDDREVRMDVGADDVFVLWVNGQEAGRRDEMHWSVVGQHKISVRLKKGWNEVVLFVGNGGGTWGFYFEVKKPDGSADSEIRAAYRP